MLIFVGPSDVLFLDLVGCGSFGNVYKAVWRGTIVAAKVIPFAENKKSLQNELDIYRTC